MKGLKFLLAICAWFLGTIGGIGYALYCNAYVIAAGVAVLAAMAFPVVKKLYQEWTDEQMKGE